MPSPELAQSAPGVFDSDRLRSRAVWAGVVLLVLVSALGTAWNPWLTFGVLIGCVLFGLTVTWPLGVIAAMLAIGPLDLSFLTGGFKTMFQQLGGLDMNGIRLIFVSAGLGLVVITERRSWGFLASPSVRWYLLFLVFAATTIPTSQDPLEGLRLLLKLAWPLLTFLVVAVPGRSHREIDRMVDWLLIGATVLIVINPLFILMGGVFVEDSGEIRLMGAGTHQNPFSFAMLVAVLVSLSRFAVRRQMRYLVVAAGATVWIALTLTRITFLAGAVSLAVVALYSAVVRRNYRAATIGAGAVVVLTLAFAPVLLERTFGVAPSPAEFLRLVQDPILLYQTINWSGRELFWGVLVLSWMASPWLGLGLGSSTAVLKSVFPEDMGLVAHNEYIRLGTDTGFLGIALFMVAMLAWLRVAVAAGLKGDPRVQEVTLPALAILMAWGVISLTDNTFDYYGPLTQFAGFFVGASLVSGTWADTSPRRLH
jgi:O-antigen ligase